MRRILLGLMCPSYSFPEDVVYDIGLAGSPSLSEEEDAVRSQLMMMIFGDCAMQFPACQGQLVMVEPEMRGVCSQGFGQSLEELFWTEAFLPSPRAGNVWVSCCHLV